MPNQTMKPCREVFEKKYGAADYHTPIGKEMFFSMFEAGWQAAKADTAERTKQELSTMLDNQMELLIQIDAKVEEVKQLREALEKLARLGNGNMYGNSEGNMIARQALVKHTGNGGGVNEPVSGKQPIETAPKGIPVIVAGGIAIQKTGGEWFTGMEEPLFQRPLQWQPKWWMPIPTDNEAARVKYVG